MELQLVPPIHLRHICIGQQQQQGGNQKIKFVNPNVDNYERNIKHAAELHKHGIPAYKPNIFPKGTTAIVVGSGPSLKSLPAMNALMKAKEEGHIVYACKQAVKYLHDHGIPVNYSVSMDPGAHIARPEKIYKAAGATQLIASSSDVLLFDYMLTDKPFDEWLKTLTDEQLKSVLEKDYDDYKEGKYIPPDAGIHPADVMIFHSATGYEHEVKLYTELFDQGACMGGGYNVVNRAVSAAIFMGVKKIICIGTDCGWRKDENFYADGSENRPGVNMSDHGIVENTDEQGKPLEDANGKEWMTRPDMLASGVALAKLAKRNPGRFIFVGDTLPAKLVNKDFEFLDKCANFGK